MIVKIAVDNSFRFEGVKIPSTLDDYLHSEVNTIKGELYFKSIDNSGQWSQYCYIQNYDTKRGKDYVHHTLTTGSRPVPANKEGKRTFGAWEFHYSVWENTDKEHRQGATTSNLFP